MSLEKGSCEGTQIYLRPHYNTLQHSATRCSSTLDLSQTTLQHTATHYNTLQHTATHCNTLQHSATLCNSTVDLSQPSRANPVAKHPQQRLLLCPQQRPLLCPQQRQHNNGSCCAHNKGRCLCCGSFVVGPLLWVPSLCCLRCGHSTTKTQQWQLPLLCCLF